MANTIVMNPNLYTKPPKTAIPGARRIYEEMAITPSQTATTNIFALAVLPAGHRLHDLIVESTDMDSATSAAINVGFLNCYYNTSPNPNISSPALNSPLLISASTIPQAGGYARSGATLTPIHSQSPDPANDQIVAVQFSASPGTPTSGTIGVSFIIDFD